MEEREEYRVDRKKDTEGHHIARVNMKFTLDNGRVINVSGKYKKKEDYIDLDFKENGKGPVHLDNITLEELRVLFLSSAESMAEAMKYDDDEVLDSYELTIDAAKYHKRGL